MFMNLHEVSRLADNFQGQRGSNACAFGAIYIVPRFAPRHDVNCSKRTAERVVIGAEIFHSPVMTFGSARDTAEDGVNNRLIVILRSSEGLGLIHSLCHALGSFHANKPKKPLTCLSSSSLAISKANQLAGDSASVRLKEKSVENVCGLVGGIVRDPYVE